MQVAAFTHHISGPTQIHSRYRLQGGFTARIEIEFAHPDPGVEKRIPFTLQPITSKVKLAEIMRLAGEEARRAGNGSTGIRLRRLAMLARPWLSVGRTYEELRNTNERVLPGQTQSPRFTANVVVLHVSGGPLSRADPAW